MLKPIALAMTAGAICSRGTMSPIEACQAGANRAAPQPTRKVSSSSSAGVTLPVSATTARAAEAASVSHCEASMSRRRSRVSARAPASSDRKKNGRLAAVCTSATWLADGAMVAISHEAPTIWIKPPKDEASDAHQNSAKARCSKGASVSLRQRSKWERWSAASAGMREFTTGAAPAAARRLSNPARP
jgi:hypothetical protein